MSEQLLNCLDDEALIALAAPIIEMLDELHGDCDFEADCDEPAAPVWTIGAFIAGKMKEAR